MKKYEIKGKTTNGDWVLFNYFKCMTEKQLRDKLIEVLSKTAYIGVDATRVE